MDRSADDLGQILNNIERDLEELKTTQIRTENIPDGAITTPKIANDAVTEGKVADGAISTNKIEDSAVTSAKIDWDTMPAELFFTYTQTSDASGNVSIDIPLDWSKYNVIHVYGAHQQSTSASAGWLTNYLLDENKNAAHTMMFGNEFDGGGNWYGVYREKSDGEAVSCGTASGAQIWVEATIMKIGGNNVVGYNANACGGSRAQNIMGRSWPSSGSAYPSYFRVTFNYPKANGWVRAYGYR